MIFPLRATDYVDRACWCAEIEHLHIRDGLHHLERVLFLHFLTWHLEHHHHGVAQVLHNITASVNHCFNGQNGWCHHFTPWTDEHGSPHLYAEGTTMNVCFYGKLYISGQVHQIYWVTLCVCVLQNHGSQFGWPGPSAVPSHSPPTLASRGTRPPPAGTDVPGSPPSHNPPIWDTRREGHDQ